MPDSSPTPISGDQIERLVAALRGHIDDFGWVLEEVGANTIAEMTSVQAVRAMSALQRRRSFQAKASAEDEKSGD
jgi:hypothetical protein